MGYKISIVVSIYNADQTISNMIESVINQTYKDFELILINDGSTDTSLEIIKEYIQKDNRIILIDKKNSGLTKSLNLGLKKAQGKYIARLDADDIWLPNKLEQQVAYLEAHKEYALVGTAYNEIDDNGKIIYDKQRTILLNSYEDILNNIEKLNPFFHSSVLFRREILETVGFYNETFKYTQDYEYWVRIISKYKVANLTQVLASRRYSENMISIIKEKEQRIFAVKSKLLAIKRLNKPLSSYKYLINDIIVYLLPKKVIDMIRKFR